MDRLTEIDIDLQEALRLMSEGQFGRARFFVEGSLRNLRELKAAQRTADTTTSTNGTRCANCNSSYVQIGTDVMTCAMCGSTRRRY